MKVKDLRKILKNFDDNLIVIFGEDCRMGGRIFNKEHSCLEVGVLGVEETAVGPFVRFRQEDKGNFLLMDFSKSEIFTPDDFQK
jgi:hypothetical protein